MGVFPRFTGRDVLWMFPTAHKWAKAGNSSPPSSHSPGEQLLQPRVSQRSPAGPCSWRSWSITWGLCFLEASQARWGHLAAWLGVCGRTAAVVGVGACISNNHCIGRAFLWCRMQLIPWTAGNPTGLFGDSSHRAAEEKKKEIAFLFPFGK